MGITCKKATEFIVKKEEKKITFFQTIQLWQHFLICSLCKRFYKQNDIISNALSAKETVEDKKLSNEDKMSIIKLLEKDCTA